MRHTFFEVIMENLNGANYSSVDLTNNGFPITKDAAPAFPQNSNDLNLTVLSSVATTESASTVTSSP